MSTTTETNAERLKVVRAIAAALGDGWTADWFRDIDGEPYFHGRTLTSPDVTLFIREDKQGKLSIMADTPSGTKHPHGDRPTIGVSVSRGPEKIAADIRRRLLDDAIAYWNKALDNAADEKRDRENRDAAAAKLAEVNSHFRVERNPSDTGSCQVHLYAMADGAHGTASVTPTGKNVTIEIRSLPVEVAINVLRAAGQEGTA